MKFVCILCTYCTIVINDNNFYIVSLPKLDNSARLPKLFEIY